MTLRLFEPEGHQEEICNCFFVLGEKKDGMCLQNAVTSCVQRRALYNTQLCYIRQYALACIFLAQLD